MKRGQTPFPSEPGQQTIAKIAGRRHANSVTLGPRSELRRAVTGSAVRAYVAISQVYIRNATSLMVSATAIARPQPEHCDYEHQG